MPRHAIPKVINGYLHSSERACQSLPAIQVGSEAWYAWLNQPTTRSFAFHCQVGALTVRREQRQDTWYWYGYRTQDGRLHKVYLGKSEDLTSVRLHEAVVSLSPEHITNAQTSDTLPPAQPQEAPLPPPRPSSSVTSISPLPLLTTKLYVPPTRLNLVTRPRLTERMNAAMRSKLTLVVAPAGWGKTTLLSSWYAELSQRTQSLAWVSLDEGDNIRLFLDEGAAMVALLHQAATRGVVSGYGATLLEAAGERGTVEHRAPSLYTDSLLEPLTEREREVLQLLADGASNRQIADYLVLSVHTVKKHVLNICGKLGVQSRTQALAKARSLNLY